MPLGFQEVEDPRISKQSAHERDKVVGCTRRPSLPPKELFLVLISVRGSVDPRANDPIGNRTRELPAWSAVPQTTAPPRTPYVSGYSP